MKELSKNNLIKLYVDEANGGESNKLLFFKVKDMTEAGKVYLSIKKRVAKIRAAYFQNGLINGKSTRINEVDAIRLLEMYSELKEVNQAKK